MEDDQLKTPTNAGKSWSETDIADLKNAVVQGLVLAEIADFLCRTEKETTEKMCELAGL